MQKLKYKNKELQYPNVQLPNFQLIPNSSHLCSFHHHAYGFLIRRRLITAFFMQRQPDGKVDDHQTWRQWRKVPYDEVTVDGNQYFTLFWKNCDNKTSIHNINNTQGKMNQKEKQEISSPDDHSIEGSDRTMGPWSFEENLFYISFLEKNRTIMSSKKKRRELRIFDQMSSFVQTRNPLQCRSHHQKLLQKMGDFKVILKNFKKNVGKKYFKQQYRRCLVRPPLKLTCPRIKEEQEQVQTERISPQVEATPETPSNGQDFLFPYVDYAYLQGMSQQMMSGMMMVPYYFPF